MIDQHNPYESRDQRNTWNLFLEPVNGPRTQINGRTLTYDEAQNLGRKINETRDILGYAFKVVMEPAQFI
jgi:hypothetical protein